MIKIINSKSVFAVYVGLIHSGYNLSDEISAEFAEEIKSLQIEHDIINYFQSAKNESCKVNPYWPFAFTITYFAFYNEITQVHLSSKISEELISKLDNVDKSIFSKDVYKWCADIEPMILKIYNSKQFAHIWNKYITFSNKTRKQLKIKNPFVHKLISKYNITLILNELQASQLTDFVSIKDRIFIISSRVIEADIIHECLHHFFKEKLDLNRKLISENKHLLKPVYSEMANYQYAWNKESESWIRVFEENLMRAVTIALSGYSESYKEQTINMYYNEGFIYSKFIFDYLKNDINKIEDSKFVENVFAILNSTNPFSG